MGQTTLFVTTSAYVSIAGTLMNMTFVTELAFRAVAIDCKVFTDWGRRVYTNVRVAASRIGTFSTQEMKTSGCPFWGRIVR